MSDSFSFFPLEKYLLVESKGIIHIIVHKDSQAADILKSFFHSLVMAHNLGNSKSLHSDSQKWMDNEYEVFVQKVSTYPSFMLIPI